LKDRKEMEINARITCPFCRFEKEETMPRDFCQINYICGRCKRMMKPKPGTCCIFCSYSDTVCPPKQMNNF
jgi:hypothetical protein